MDDINNTEAIDSSGYFGFEQNIPTESICSLISNFFPIDTQEVPVVFKKACENQESTKDSCEENIKEARKETPVLVVKKECKLREQLPQLQQMFLSPKSNVSLTNISPVSTVELNSEQYCDITEYLTLPQNIAAKKLRLPPSTLSKRWKEASRNRKWPWRIVHKIDKEITCLLHNIPPNGEIPADLEAHLSILLNKRQQELKPVVIRV